LGLCQRLLRAESMTLTTDLIKSKIARRFILLFFFCALIPALALFFISFYRVTDQLRQQNYLNIEQETKAYGFSLLDRLLRVDEMLQTLKDSVLREKTEGRHIKNLFGSSHEQIFKALAVYSADKRIQPLWGHLSDQDLASVVREFKGKRQTQIVFRKGDELIKRIFFLAPAYQGEKVVFFLVGETEPAYIWGISPDSLLPPKTDLSVYDASGQRVIGSVFSPGNRIDEIKKQKVSSDLRLFNYWKGKKKFLAGSWSFFVKSYFANNPWTIVLSRSERDILASIQQFKNIFLRIMFLGLLLILLLLLIFIRRNLEPLDKLKEGTRQIAKKNFSAVLDIQSGDEFEELGNSFNSMTKQLQKQFRTLETIDKIDRAIFSSLDKGKIIDTSLKMMKDFFQVDCIVLGHLMVQDGSRMKAHILRHDQEPVIEYVAMSEEERRRIFNKEPFSVISETDFPKFIKGICPINQHDILVLPLIIENQFQSVLILEQKSGHELEGEELNQARQLADQVTIALSNASLVSDLEGLITGALEALARTVDAKSKWTAGHSERVADLAVKLARHMGFGEKQVELLHRGGLLHDIGKIGIPLSIIDKPESLTKEEYDEVKIHPLIGQRILEPIEAYRDIIPLIAQHHERYDGKGYPLGLSGKAIDPLARIMTVVDVFDALISNRPYRDGWVVENAKKFIVEGSGSHFDPEVVKAFMEFSEVQV